MFDELQAQLDKLTPKQEEERERRTQRVRMTQELNALSVQIGYITQARRALNKLTDPSDTRQMVFALLDSMTSGMEIKMTELEARREADTYKWRA